MTKWTKTTNYIFIGIILSVVVIYGISYLTILKPLQEELVKAEEQADLFESSYESIINQTDDEIGEDLENVTVQVPNAKSPDNVLINFQKIAQTSGVLISSITSGGGTMADEDDDDNTLNSTSYSLEVSGDNLEQISNFLNAILNSERLMIVENLNIYQADEYAALSLSVTTYYSSF
ncbi:type 4a pilus biogenesis protein PilO [Ornithinibacillus halophilus]|uniref:Tfp pilus assembly protein PilO n=1 Tax=Ornithinibacillus halophilus TaxID=930117 RepID=A0A1M5EHC0_9BACI|nr:type 4a pilus biogenesis protein PilO [Ornithinibacillus halophilus]SHF78645.1 Tfp pilus assembly protein PilO [Ornithinibacillus halophilus]